MARKLLTAFGMRNLMRGVVVVATALAGAAAYGEVHADPPDGVSVQGWVIALDGGEVVIDLGAAAGAHLGDTVELWRPIKVKHPVTGKVVTDRFLIGKLRITQVRDVVSLARPEGTLLRDVAVADVVIFYKTGASPKPPVKPPVKPTASAPSGTAAGTAGTTVPLPVPPIDTTLSPPADPETEELGKLFEDLEGSAPELRAKRYEQFVAKWPYGKYKTVLLEEAAALRSPVAKPKGDDPGANSASFARPKEVLVDTALTFGIEVAGNVVGAVLYIKQAHETTYAPLPMVAAGPGYFRVVAPKERLRPPFVSYFIEAVFQNGKMAAIEGTPNEPHTLKVIDAKAASAPNYERTFVLWTDYSDYNRLRGNDYAWQTEGFFGLRFGDVGLRAARSGFGVYKGKGGSIQELDKDVPQKDGRPIGLTYGYVEAEAGVTPIFSMIARAVIGLGKDGVTGGFQGFFRIGNDKRTNMQLGGEFLGGVGVRGIAQLELDVLKRVPLMFRTEVTNQPAGTTGSSGPYVPERAYGAADLGVRFVGQVGYQFMPAFTFHVRASYQGRDINHMGPGFGAGATIAW